MLCDQTFSFVSTASVFNKTWKRVLLFFIPWMTFVTQCCKSPHIQLHGMLCNKLTLSHHRTFAVVQCQPPLLFVPTIRKLTRRQFSEFPFAAASEIAPE
jgi:hypothetical protein